jgi:putative aminopeptidase FrvX
MNRLLENLEEFCNKMSPSGHETDMVECISSKVEKVADSIYVDNLGNLVVEIGNSQKDRLLIDAHMDEVGLVVLRVTESGQILFDKLGLVDDRVLLAREVAILSKTGVTRGVVGIKGRHLMNADELGNHIDASQMWIDTGLSAGELKAKGIMPGCGICFTTKFQSFPNQFIMGKSLDCRIGCAVAVEVIHRICENAISLQDKTRLAFVFTSQEEIGAKGASTVAFNLKPKAAIVLDTVPCDDSNYAGSTSGIRLGKGPVIRMYDSFPQSFLASWTHPVFRELLPRIAEKEGISYQVDVMTRTFLDSSTLQFTGAGIPTASICFPRRYSHSPTEIAHLGDIENSILLLIATLEELANGVQFDRIIK